MNPFLSQADPIYIIRREGTKENPYAYITETLQVSSGKVILTEIPEQFSKVIVKNITGDRLGETLSQFPNINQFHVDYRNGIVYFNEVYNGTKFSFEYKGIGVISLPASRMYIQEEISTLPISDKISEMDDNINSQKSRLDAQLSSIPQPSEIVDLRVDSTGATHAVARDRLISDENKINKRVDDLTTDANTRFSSTFQRLDLNEADITTNTQLINANGVRIDDLTTDTNGKFDTVNLQLEEKATKIVSVTYNGVTTKFLNQTTTIYVAPDPSVANGNDGLSVAKPIKLSHVETIFNALKSVFPRFIGTWTVQLSSGTFQLDGLNHALMLTDMNVTNLVIKGSPVTINTQPTTIIDGNYNYVKSLTDPISDANRKAICDLYRYKHGFYLQNITNGLVTVQDIKFQQFRVPNYISNVLSDLPESGGTRCGLVFDTNVNAYTVNVWAEYCDWAGVYFTGWVAAKTKGGKIRRCRSGVEAIFNCKVTFGYGGFKGTNQLPDLSTSPIIEECSETGIGIREASNGHIDCCTLNNNRVGIQLSNCTGVNLFENYIYYDGVTNYATPNQGIRWINSNGIFNSSIVGYPQKQVFESNSADNYSKEYTAGTTTIELIRPLSVQTTGWKHFIQNLSTSTITEFPLFFVEGGMFDDRRLELKIDLIFRAVSYVDTSAKVNLCFKQGSTYFKVATANIVKDNAYHMYHLEAVNTPYSDYIKAYQNIKNDLGTVSFNYQQLQGYDSKLDSQIVLQVEGFTTASLDTYQYKITKQGLS